jgi:hypothetical protein
MQCASPGRVDHLYCLLQLNHRHGSGAAAAILREPDIGMTAVSRPSEFAPNMLVSAEVRLPYCVNVRVASWGDQLDDHERLAQRIHKLRCTVQSS